MMHAELLSHCAQIRPTLMALAGLSFLTFRGGEVEEQRTVPFVPKSYYYRSYADFYQQSKYVGLLIS